MNYVTEEPPNSHQAINNVQSLTYKQNDSIAVCDIYNIV